MIRGCGEADADGVVHNFDKGRIADIEAFGDRRYLGQPGDKNAAVGKAQHEIVGIRLAQQFPVQGVGDGACR